MPSLQLLEQAQDLRLGGDVQRGRRLVGDDERRLQRQRHRDHHALTLTAGQLVWIARENALGLGQRASPNTSITRLAPFGRCAAWCGPR